MIDKHTLAHPDWASRVRRVPTRKPISARGGRFIKALSQREDRRKQDALLRRYVGELVHGLEPRVEPDDYHPKHGVR